MRAVASTGRGGFPGQSLSGRVLLARIVCRFLAGYRFDWSRVPATSAQARLSAFDVPTAVAAAKGEHGMSLGNGGLDADSGLAVPLAE